MFINVQTIARNLKQPKCPSIGEWILNLWLIYTVKYNLIIKRNKLVIEITQVNFVDIKLSKKTTNTHTDIPNDQSTRMQN